MTDKTYVALAPLRFGDSVVQPGEVVPHIPGRDYARLVELKLITEQVVVSGEAAPAFSEGTQLLFVRVSGKLLRVAVVEQVPLPPEAVDALPPGEQGLWVKALNITDTLRDEGYTDDPFVVPVRQLIDNDVAEALLARLEEAHKAGERQEASKISALEAKLAEVQAEVESLQSALAEAQARPSLPEDALARLEAVSGISEKLAKKALAALTAPTENGEGGSDEGDPPETDAVGDD